MERTCPNCNNTFFSVEIDTKGCDTCGWPTGHVPAQLAEQPKPETHPVGYNEVTPLNRPAN